MSEYIVNETVYPGAIKQEVVGELVRCRDCKYHPSKDFWIHCPMTGKGTRKPDDYCSYGERKDE